MRLRVVCGLGLMMANFSPTNAFSKVDLPALGRPRMQTKPERKDIKWCGNDYISLLALLRWWRCARVRRAVLWSSTLQSAIHLPPTLPLFAECGRRVP